MAPGPSTCPRCGSALDPQDFEHCPACNHCRHESVDLDGPEDEDGTSRGTCTVCRRKVVMRREGHEEDIELAPEAVS